MKIDLAHDITPHHINTFQKSIIVRWSYRPDTRMFSAFFLMTMDSDLDLLYMASATGKGTFGHFK